MTGRIFGGKRLLCRGLASVLTFFIVFTAGGSLLAKEKSVLIKMETTLGDITIELDSAKAPLTVENILKYVEEGFYEGTIFHRVVAGFVIQGGGLTEDMKEKQTNKPVKNEADNGLTNEPYTLSMARTPDPHSATSQFFINLAANGFLNHRAKDADGWGYAVFGKVVEGREVVDKIGALAVGNKGMHQDVPKETVTITKVTVIEDQD